MWTRTALLFAALVGSTQAATWECYSDLKCMNVIAGSSESDYYDCFNTPGVLGAALAGGGECFMNKYDCWKDCECVRYDYCSGEEHDTPECAASDYYDGYFYPPSQSQGNAMGQYIGGEWKTGYEACFIKKGSKSASIWGFSFYQAYEEAGQFVANPTYDFNGASIPYICDVNPDADPKCPPPVDVVVDGDPHFQTINGEWFDFHGECDLVFLEVPSLNATVHVRTLMQFDMYSYVEAAVIQINGDVLEMSAYGNAIYNGFYLTADDTELPATVGGYPFEVVKSNKKAHTYKIHLGGNNYIKLKSYKFMVGVTFSVPKDLLSDAVGLLGSVKNEGEFLGRDKKTVFDNANDFGLDWVVRPGTDPSLFETPAVNPGKCRMPDPKKAAQNRRRLGESMARSEAEEACAKWTMNKEACIQDVLATGDKEMAENHY